MGSFDVGSLNAVDILILAIFFISIIIGFGRGLVSEVISLATLIAAFVVAIMFSNTLAAYFTNTATMQGVVSQTSTAVGSSTAAPASYMAIGVSFAILFAGTIIIGMLVKMLLNLMLASGVIGFGNRVFGGVFGLVRGGLINLVLVFLIQLSPFAKAEWWQQSHYVPYFEPYVEKLANITSPALADLKSTFNLTIEKAAGSAGATNTTSGSAATMTGSSNTLQTK